MTVKEKAKELVVKMLQNEREMPREYTKQCSIIAVDEILEIFKGLAKPEDVAFDVYSPRKYNFESEYSNFMTGYDMAEFYQQVKQELEKM